MDPLRYHKFPVPGKIEIMPTKDCKTQQDLSCSDFYVRLGVKKENILLCDSQGFIFKGRASQME